jgi:anti-sigma regulatory factor (Ser/Thr protein kinase)
MSKGSMKQEFPYRIAVSFPGELDYIPLVRKLFSDILLELRFSPKFTFRSELIIDELCNNAVSYAAAITRSSVDLMCEVHRDRVEFIVKDRGGSSDHVLRLQEAVAAESPWKDLKDKNLGLELVRMLSENVSYSIDEKNLTQVHVVRRREELH